MSVWKKIMSVVFFLGLMLTLSACVVTRDPGYHSPHVHAAFWWYYPDYQIYYHTVDHYYYYYDRGAWIRAATLPWRFSLHDHRRVRIEISGLPYLRHSHHLKRYPPARSNHRHRDDDRRHRPDDDHRPGADNEHRHRSGGDVKEGVNIFRPHLKDKKYEDKREKYDDDKRFNRSREQQYRKQYKKSNSVNDDAGRKVETEQKNSYKEKKKIHNDKRMGKNKANHADKRNGREFDDSEDENREDRKPHKKREWDK